MVCFPPSDTANLVLMESELNIRQGIYLNNYCARSIPTTEFFPIYILVHGLLLVAPHYIWSSVHNGDFDSFFAIAKKFDRLRDPKTGDYHVNNFNRVTKLELEYGRGKRKIFNAYIFKLFIQLCVCIGSIAFSAKFFTDFMFSFDCPRDFSTDNIPHGWPINTTVVCVYTSLRILSLVRYADFFLNALALALTIYGFMWCFMRHTGELGHLQIAKFSFQSCLSPDSFVFPPVVSWPVYPCFCRCRKVLSTFCRSRPMWIIIHYPCPHFQNMRSPRVQSDLDFLVMRLFRADSSHGVVFRDIQVSSVH